MVRRKLKKQFEDYFEQFLQKEYEKNEEKGIEIKSSEETIMEFVDFCVDRFV